MGGVLIDNMPVLFKDMKPGDKIYEYVFISGCSVREHEIKSVSKPNECNCCEISFKNEPYINNIMLWANAYIKYDNYKYLVIWTTIGMLDKMFSIIFDEGVESNKANIRAMLGIENNC